MLKDEKEASIMASAIQPGLREASRSGSAFARIVDDFGLAERFAGASVCDLGPGHYELAELARENGADRIVGIDNDPAVVRLGDYRGFEPMELDFRALPNADIGRFDVLFCKWSFNAFWFPDDDEAHAAWVEAVCGLLEPGGTAWLAPWNRPPEDLAADRIARVIEVQRAGFRAAAFDMFEPDEEQRRRWAMTATNLVDTPIFLRGLDPPAERAD